MTPGRKPNRGWLPALPSSLLINPTDDEGMKVRVARLVQSAGMTPVVSDPPYTTEPRDDHPGGK